MTERINNELLFVAMFMELEHEEMRRIAQMVSQKLMTSDLLFIIDEMSKD